VFPPLKSLPVRGFDPFISVGGEEMHMADMVSVLFNFIIALIISTVIIFVVTKFFGEKETIITALIAAIVGTVVYTIVYYFLGGLIAAFIAGIVWLVALQSLYRIGWVKSLVIAVIVWLVTSVVGWFLPTLAGPV
jgi:L-lactate permease